MNKPIERELKLLLTKEEYEKIGKSYDFSEGFIQTNTYYDSNDSLLKERKCAMRIRTIDNHYYFTLKIKSDSITHIELEKEIDTNQLEQIKDLEILGWMKEYNIPKDCIEIASFTTYRKVLETDEATICLDENRFKNHIDYEMEYEYKKEHDGLTAFNSLLEPFHLSYKNNSPSKLARAIQSL